jgi:replicative DNA helicase
MDPFFAESDEYGLLGACMAGGHDVCHEAFAAVPSHAFQVDALRDIYDLLKGLVAANQPVGITDVAKAWSKSMPAIPVPFEAINRCDELCPSPANHPEFAKAVLDAHHRRQLRLAGDRLIRESAVLTLGVDQIVSNAEAGLTVEASKEEIRSSKSVVTGFIDATQARFARKGELSGITSGFPRLDRMTDGFQPGELAIIAARPSIGKTAIAISIAKSAAIDARIPTLFVSLEMSDESIVRRMVSTVGSIPMHDIKTGELDQGGMRSMTAASAKIAASPIHFASGSGVANIATITALVRRAVRKWGVRLVLVDYLQKIHGTKTAEKRTYEIAEVSGKLKAVAADTGVALIALAQLNRENRQD